MRPALHVAALALICCASISNAGGMSPPPSSGGSGTPPEKTLGAIKAVVVKSWGAGSASLVWDYLNAYWSTYGAVPIFIDYNSLHSVASFTLADLQNSGADVVIVGDAAGGGSQWSASEVAALQTYASQGHPLIGTYAMLMWSGADNRALAPLFGLRPDIDYNTVEVAAAPSTAILAPADCLFDRITDPMMLGGYPRVEVPLDNSWDPSDLADASFVARSADGLNVVTDYNSGNLHACYISYMPEYQLGLDFDATQYLYNAIVCHFGVTPAAKSSWGRLKAIYR